MPCLLPGPLASCTCSQITTTLWRVDFRWGNINHKGMAVRVQRIDVHFVVWCRYRKLSSIRILTTMSTGGSAAINTDQESLS